MLEAEQALRASSNAAAGFGGDAPKAYVQGLHERLRTFEELRRAARSAGESAEARERQAADAKDRKLREIQAFAERLAGIEARVPGGGGGSAPEPPGGA